MPELKVKTFEDLYCWQKARTLVKIIYQLTKSFSDFSLKDQVRRAAVSVLSNIAEGFERGNKDELLYFLYIAKASCGEVRAQLYVALDQGFINKQEFREAFNLAKQTSGVIYKFIESIKVSKYQGLRWKRQTKDSAEEFKEVLRKKYLNKKIYP